MAAAPSSTWSSLPGLQNSQDSKFLSDFSGLIGQYLPGVDPAAISGSIQAQPWYGKLGSGSNPYVAARDVVQGLGAPVDWFDPGVAANWTSTAEGRSPEAIARANDSGGLGSLLPGLGIGALALLAGQPELLALEEGGAETLAGEAVFNPATLSGAGEAVGAGVTGTEVAAGVTSLSTAAGGAGGAFDMFGSQATPGSAFEGFNGSVFGPQATATINNTAGGGFWSDFMNTLGIGGSGTGGDSSTMDMLKKLGLIAGPVGGALSLGSGLLGLSQAGKLRSAANATPQSAPIYDPFASQRAGYMDQLTKLSTDPSYLTNLPGYTAGLEATRRGSASAGYNLSGNELSALQQYGGNAFNQEATRLAGLAGANISPMVAGTSPNPLAGTVAANDLVSRSLASLGYAARSFGV